MAPEEESKFKVVGLQPFHRPAQQKGYAYQLDIEEDFATRGASIYFRHSKVASQQIFEEFKQGEALYPYDPILEKAEQHKQLNMFSKQALKILLEKESSLFSNPFSYYEELLKKHGITFKEKAPLQFTEEEKIKIRQNWHSNERELFYSQIDLLRLTYL